MPRYKDLEDFEEQLPELGGLVRHGTAPFLISMRERIENREHLTPKMLSTLRRWGKDESPVATATAGLLPKTGFIVRDSLVNVIGVYVHPEEAVVIFEFVHPDGWKGRIKDVKTGSILDCARSCGWSAELADEDGEMGKVIDRSRAFPLVVERATVLWSKESAGFVILGSAKGGATMSLSLPGLRSGSKEDLPDPIRFDFGNEDTDDIAITPPAPVELVESENPESEEAQLLPEFSDWQTKLSL